MEHEHYLTFEPFRLESPQGRLLRGDAVIPLRLRSLAVYTPTNRFAQLGVSVADGHAPAAGGVAVLTAWLLAFGSYAVFAYRRSARTV